MILRERRALLNTQAQFFVDMVLQYLRIHEDGSDFVFGVHSLDKIESGGGTTRVLISLESYLTKM